MTVFSGLLNPYPNQVADFFFSLGEAPVYAFGVVHLVLLYFLAHGLINILPGVQLSFLSFDNRSNPLEKQHDTTPSPFSPIPSLVFIK